MSTVKVGDELAFVKRYGKGWDFYTVTGVTPSGRIKCGPYTLNADLTVRGGGRNDPYAAKVITEEMREQNRDIEEHRRLRHIVEDVPWREVSTDQLRRIVAILDEGAAQ